MGTRGPGKCLIIIGISFFVTYIRLSARFYILVRFVCQALCLAPSNFSK
jgi:hypothetical protein